MFFLTCLRYPYDDPYQDIRYKFCSFSADELLTRFTNLRNNYVVNKKKVAKSMASGAGKSGVYVPTFVHYKALEFLRDTVKPDTSTSTMKQPQPPRRDSASTSTFDSTQDDTTYRVDPETGLLEEDNVVEELDVQGGPEDESEIPASNPRKRRGSDNSQEMLSQQTAAAIAALERVGNKRSPVANESTAFGQTVGFALLKMTNWNRRRAMQSIHKILYRFDPENPRLPLSDSD